MQISVKAIIAYRDNFLLLRPKHITNLAQGWDGPGGTVKNGESLQQALKREVREETGIKIKNIAYLQSLVFPNVSTQYKIFWCESDTDQVILSDEHTGFKWVDAKEFKELTGYDLTPLLVKIKEKLQK